MKVADDVQREEYAACGLKTWQCIGLVQLLKQVKFLFIINLVQLPQLHNFIFKKHCSLTPVLECQNCSLKNRVLREGSFNMKGGTRY